jgi:protein-S-isoprenylcysteine O-methyltransferase Ste14
MSNKVRGKMRKIDRFEQIVVLALYLGCIFRLWPNKFDEINIISLLVLISEGFVVLLLLIRKPTDQISNNFWDWLIAFSGSFFPLLIGKGGEPLMFQLGLFFILFGMSIHVGAKLSLFRSFGLVPADRGIKVKGLYSFVRHPMYAGYFLSHLGYFFAAPSFRNLAVYICCWLFLLLRIFAEEKVLLKSIEYQEYIKRVSYRLIPGVF